MADLGPFGAGRGASECANVSSEGEPDTTEVVLNAGTTTASVADGVDDGLLAATTAPIAAAAAREQTAVLVIAAAVRRSMMPMEGLEGL